MSQTTGTAVNGSAGTGGTCVKGETFRSHCGRSNNAPSCPMTRAVASANQAVALDLFDANGYAAVTVEQIAEASEVSPSSVYRYFGTKEQIVLWDEFDALQVDVLAEALSDAVPLGGVRRTLEHAIGALSAEDERVLIRRLELIMRTPALEQVSIGQTYLLSEAIGDALAARLGRAAADLEVQVFAHALVGGMIGMLHHWQGSGFVEPLSKVLERAFAIFEAGLDVVAAPEA